MEAWIAIFSSPISVALATYFLNTKIKRLESEQADHLAKLNAMLDRGQVIHTAAATKRIDAVHAIWGTTVSIRKSFPMFLYLFDEWSENGYGIYELEDRRAMVFHKSTLECEEIFKKAGIDQYRPHVPTGLFDVFAAYREFVLSVLHLSRTHFPDADCPWYSHKETLALIQKHIPDYQFNDIMLLKKDRLRLVLDALESTIDKACRSAISGAADSDEYAELLKQKTIKKVS